MLDFEYCPRGDEQYNSTEFNSALGYTDNSKFKIQHSVEQIRKVGG
jgi:hypothetical protein